MAEVLLDRISHLELGPDAAAETVTKLVAGIDRVEEIEVPKSIYMLIAMTQRQIQSVLRY